MAARMYEDFDPSAQIIDENDCETIRVSVPGFRKDKLRVQLTSTNLVRISGEREMEAGKSLRFQKEFPIKSNIDTNRISAKFELGLLNVKLPKLIITEGNKPPVPQTPKPDEPQPQPQPQPQESHVGQQKATEMSDKENDGSNQNAASQKHEPKSNGTNNPMENDGKKARDVGSGKSETREDKYQVTAADLASKLKMSRRIAYVVMVGFSAVALALYATNFITSYTSSEFSG